MTGVQTCALPICAGPRGVGGDVLHGAQAPAPVGEDGDLAREFVDEVGEAAVGAEAQMARPRYGAQGDALFARRVDGLRAPCSGDERERMDAVEPQVAGQQPAAVGREGDAVEVGLLLPLGVDAAAREADDARRGGEASRAVEGEERDAAARVVGRGGEAPRGVEGHKAGGRAAGRLPLALPERAAAAVEGQAHERRRLVAGLADCVEAASVIL